MISPAKSTRKSSRLEVQSQTPPSASRKSERLPPRPPPASPAPPTPAGRKSERLDTPTGTRKSGRFLRSDTPSPVGNTGRSRKRSSAPGLVEGLITKKKKREKKERSIEMLQTETSEIPPDYEQHCMPLKRRLDGRSYKALYKVQRKRIGTADSNKELRRTATIHEDDLIDNVDNCGTTSQLLGDKKDLDEIKSVDNGATSSPLFGDKKDMSEIKSVDNGATSSPLSGDKKDMGEIKSVDNGATSSPLSGDKKDTAEIKSVDNDGATSSPLSGDKKDMGEIKSVDNDGATSSLLLGDKKDLGDIKSVNGATSSQLLGDKKDLGKEPCCRVADDLRNDLPEGVCEGTLLESHSGLNESNAHSITNNVEDITSIRPENGLALSSSNEGNEVGLNMEASESVTPSTSSAIENPDFVANCSICSKKRRLVFDSPEEDLCSCTNTPKGNISDSCRESLKGAFVKLHKVPVGGSTTAGDSLLNNVNRLREFWHKKQNAVVVDEIERMVNMIFFIFSLSDVQKPFLVSGTSDTLVKWEAKFIQLKPSINVVVYQAARGGRNSIRSIEFHREGGGKMIQVLLCSIDVISEESQILKHLKCEILILDECQFSMNFALLKMLDADMRILLFSGSLKVDSSSLKDKKNEFLSVLSFLYPPGELDKIERLKYEETDSLVKLVESFSSFIAYDSTKFVEYWVPVPLSNLQLEQYCHTLHSGSSALTSHMKTDVVGDKVYDVLMTVRKCCDHPYVADQKLVVSRIKHGYSSSENVDFGIKASGKLHLLCKLLSKMKSHKLRALVLYQSFDGSPESIGDILEDLLRDRFGADQYERIDRHVNQSKKQAAVNRFGQEDSKQFVFLLENRACQPWIKLSVDVVVIFSSEWAPSCDIRTLERLSFNSLSGKVPIFRLYCSCTIEEKALILGKHLPVLNARTTSSTLLMWGATSLFSRLEDYHAGNSNASDVDVSSEHALLDDVVKDLMAILSDTAVSNSQNSSIISKAFMSIENGNYHTDRPLLGETKYQRTVGEPVVLFWKTLLGGRSPQWKFSHEPPIRNRKRVFYSDESPKNSEIPHDEAGKKRKKMDSTSVIANNPLEPDAKEMEIAGSEKDALVTGTTNRSQLPSSSDSRMAELRSGNALNSSSLRKSFSRQNSVSQPDNRSLSDEQQSLLDFLKANIAKLWKALKLTDDVLLLVHRILEHIMEKYNVSKDDPNVLQAFQMSLCWIAVDMLGQTIDKKSSLLEARKIINFECSEDMANIVHTKLTALKKTFPQPPGKMNDSVSLKNVASPLGVSTLHSSSLEGPRVKVEVEDISSPSLQHNQEPNNPIAVTKMHKKLKKVQKKIEKYKLRLLQKHEEEIHEFNKTWKAEREKLEEERKVKLVVVGAIHSQSAMKMDKLKAADIEFDKAIKELECSMERELKELEKKHAAEVEEENKNNRNWLAEAEKFYGGGQSAMINDVNTHGIESGNDRQFSPTSGTTTRVLGRSPPTTIVGDPVVSDVSANGVTEPMTMRGGVPVSAEQFEAASVSSQNPKDVSVAEATSNGQIVDVIQSTNRDAGADSGLPGNHGGSLPQDGLSTCGTDLANACNESVARNGRSTTLRVSVDSTGLEAASASDCQVDNEQSDLRANIMDSTDDGSRSDSRAAGGPGNIPDDEQSVEAQLQNPVTPQVNEYVGEPQPALGNAEDGVNTVDSLNHALSEVAGNAAEFQNGDVLLVGSNLVSSEPNFLAPDLRTGGGIGLQLNGELLAASQNPASVSRVAPMAVETQNPILQPGPSSVELPHLRAAWQQRLRVLTDPLQSEIEKIWKDREQVIKKLEDTKSQLRTECEKEIVERTAQIHNKYAAKMKDAESSYLAKRAEIEANQSKVFMNKLLAEAFRSKCLDFRPSGAPVAYPGVPSGSLQQHPQLIPSQSSLRQSSVSQPAPTHHQTVYPAHHYPGVGSSSQTGIVQQQTLHPTVHSTHRPANLSGIPSRPPPLQISSHTPNINTSRVGGADIRAPAPHLQPFRPSSSVSSPSIHPLPPPQQPVAAQVPRSTAIPPAPQPVPLSINHPSSSNGRISEGEGAPLPAMELLRNVCNPGNSSQPLPVAVSNKAGDMSDSNAVTSIRGTADVVCLSDDDN